MRCKKVALFEAGGKVGLASMVLDGGLICSAKSAKPFKMENYERPHAHIGQ
jgi:hypothetical protein